MSRSSSLTFLICHAQWDWLRIPCAGAAVSTHQTHSTPPTRSGHSAFTYREYGKLRSATSAVLRMLTLLGLWCSMMSAEPPPSSRLISRRYGRLWLPVRSVPPLPYGCRQLSDNFGHLKPPDLVICQAALYVIHRVPVYRGLPYLLRPPPIVCLAQYSIASLSISSSVLLRVSDIQVSISDRLKNRCFPLL